MTIAVFVSQSLVSLSVIAEAIMVILIIKCKKLHLTRYYIIANLCVSDVMDGIVFIYYDGYLISKNDRLNHITKINYVFPMLFLLVASFNTWLIIVDRYIAVIYPLKYHIIVSRKRVLLALCLSWIIPATILLCLLEKPKENNVWSDYRYSDMILQLIIISLLAVSTVVAGRHISSISRQHNAAILSRRQYFGVVAEERSLFEKAKRSAYGMLQLSYWTVFVVVTLQTSVIIYRFASYQNMKYILIGVKIIYSASNPIIYFITQKELRNEMRRIFRCRNNVVAPQ